MLQIRNPDKKHAKAETAVAASASLVKQLTQLTRSSAQGYFCTHFCVAAISQFCWIRYFIVPKV